MEWFLLPLSKEFIMSETKWLDLIKLVNSGQPVNSRYDGGVHEADAADFSEIFGFGPSWSEEFSRRVKKHWINSWLCTDTVVGLAVYVMDGKPVAVSEQTSRKGDEEIKFISKEARDAVIAFLLEITEWDRVAMLGQNDAPNSKNLVRVDREFSFQIEGLDHA
jgi:hypothetical protein